MTLQRYDLRLELLDATGRTRDAGGQPNPPGTYVCIGHQRVAATPETVAAQCQAMLDEWRATEGRRFSEDNVRNARVHPHPMPGEPLRATDFYRAAPVRVAAGWELRSFLQDQLHLDVSALDEHVLESGPLTVHLTTDHHSTADDRTVQAGYATFDGEAFAAFATVDYGNSHRTYVTSRPTLTRLTTWLASLQQHEDLTFTDPDGPVMDLESFGGVNFRAQLLGERT